MRLDEAIANLNREFAQILDNVNSNIKKTADTSYDESVSSLQSAKEPGGTHYRVQQTKERLEGGIARHKQFLQKLEQLEQIYHISEDLKNVVRDIERRSK